MPQKWMIVGLWLAANGDTVAIVAVMERGLRLKFLGERSGPLKEHQEEHLTTAY